MDERIVWFDLDDTLWDFHANSPLALEHVFRHFRLERYWDDIGRWQSDYHKVNDPLWDDLAAGRVTHEQLRFRRFYDTFVNAGMSVDEARTISLEADSFYLDRLGRCTRTVEGAREILMFTRNRGFKTGILSNGFSGVQDNKLKSGGLAELVDFVVLSDHADANKPDRRIFDFACKVADVQASQCIMVGDNGDTDIAGALLAGWPTAIWYNPNGRQPGQLLRKALEEAPGKLINIKNLLEIASEHLY